MVSNVGYSSSVYRPGQREQSQCPDSLCNRLRSELKFHGPFLGLVLTVVGLIHFLK